MKAKADIYTYLLRKFKSFTQNFTAFLWHVEDFIYIY